MKLEPSASRIERCRSGDRNVRKQVPPILHGRDSEPDLGLLLFGHLGIGQPRPRSLQAPREEASQSSGDGVAGMEPGIRMDGADLRIAAAVIEVPVSIDECGDRLPALARIGQDLLLVIEMPAGIDHHKAVPPLEDDRIAVGRPSLPEIAWDDLDRRESGGRWAACRRAGGER